MHLQTLAHPAENIALILIFVSFLFTGTPLHTDVDGLFIFLNAISDLSPYSLSLYKCHLKSERRRISESFLRSSFNAYSIKTAICYFK